MSLQPAAPNPDGDLGEVLKVWSCINCRRRKVRCDRRHPCTPCTRNKADCVFPASGRIPRRRPKPSGQKQAELVGRLRRLEAMVGELGSQVEQAAVAGQVDASLEGLMSATGVAASERDWSDNRLDLSGELGNETSQDEEQNGLGMGSSPSGTSHISDELGHLVVEANGELVVGDRFWTVFCKEVEQIFEAVKGPNPIHFDVDSGSSTSPSSSSGRAHVSYYNFLLRSTSSVQKQEDLRPLPSQMLFVWQTYVDNVDPFMKILHVPTTTKIIRELKGSYDSLDRGTECLVMAICFAAINSLAETEVLLNFNTDKNQLLACYRLGTEQALNRADFLNSTVMTSLQALTIYLEVLHHRGEENSAWILAGVLVRLAVYLNLHHDGSNITNITPFEAEMRRRLWWQICLIDSRSGDVKASDFKVSEGMFDTTIPANVDDSNIGAGISKVPAMEGGWSDMTAFLIRCQIWQLSRQIQPALTSGSTAAFSSDDALNLFRQFRATIEATYLKHMNPEQPLQAFVTAMARLFLAKLEFILHSKQLSERSVVSDPFDSSRRDELFASSLSIIEYTNSLEHEPRWSSWRWQIQGRQPPWHALHVVLSQLILWPWDSICERAWLSAKNCFESLSPATYTENRYRLLSKLLSAVQRYRTDELQRLNSMVPAPPHTNVAGVIPSVAFGAVQQSHMSRDPSSWMTKEPFINIEPGLHDNIFDEELDMQIDWPSWDELAGELDPSLEFWDMNERPLI